MTGNVPDPRTAPGYAGAYTVTDTPCPRCLSAGRSTAAGAPITLRRREDDTTHYLRCVHCNYVPQRWS